MTRQTLAFSTRDAQNPRRSLKVSIYISRNSMRWQNYKDLMSSVTIISVHKFIKQQIKPQTNLQIQCATLCIRVQKSITEIVHAFKATFKTVLKKKDCYSGTL